MHTIRIASALFLASMLTGCDDRPVSSQKPAAEAERGVFAPQLQALDKAKGVEQTLQQGADSQRRAIDEAAK